MLSQALRLVRSSALVAALLVPPLAAQQQRWVRQLGTADADLALVTVADGAGGVLVAGQTSDALAGANAGLQDVWVARFDAAGARVWVRQLGSSGWETARAGTSDAAGGLYVCGSTGGSLAGPVLGFTDAWLARYDAAGSALWVRQLGASGADGAYAAAPDGTGGVLVGGLTDGDLGSPGKGKMDPWLARYDGAGALLWIRQPGSSLFDVGYALATDGSGGAYLGGWTHVGSDGLNAVPWVARFDGAGQLLWTRRVAGVTIAGDVALAPDGAGGVLWYAVSALKGPGLPAGSLHWLARLDPAGTELWTRQLELGTRDRIASAASDGAGGVILGGTRGAGLSTSLPEPPDALAARFDATGQPSWLTAFGTSADDSCLAVATNDARVLFAAGTTQGDLGSVHAGSGDAWVARFLLP